MLTLIHLVFVGCTSGDQQFSESDVDGTNQQGTTKMFLEPTELSFTDLNWEEGVSASMDFTVTNVGAANLELTVIDIADSGDDVFYMVEQTNIIVIPKDSRTFTVAATLNEYIQATGTLRIKANDIDYLDYRMPLTATPIDWVDTGGDDTGY